MKNINKHSVDCIDVGRQENSKNKLVSINRYAVSILIQEEESKSPKCPIILPVLQKPNITPTPHSIKKN